MRRRPTPAGLPGLNVRAILNEPTAAAIAYGLEQGEDQIVLVYDLGGGTFDITMIEIKDRLIRVICTGGDHRLGGVLWDEAIVMYLAEQFKTQTGEEGDPLDDPEVLNDSVPAGRARQEDAHAARESAVPGHARAGIRRGSSSTAPSSRKSPSTCSTARSS